VQRPAQKRSVLNSEQVAQGFVLTAFTDGNPTTSVGHHCLIILTVNSWCLSYFFL